MPRFHIKWMSLTKYFFIFSSIMLVISIGSLAIRGLQFGVEFQGGSVITITDGMGKTTNDVRNAFTTAGFKNVEVQTSRTANENGFLVKTTTANADVANRDSLKAGEQLGMDSNNFSISTVGAGWGKKLTTSALTALLISILAIILYISIRFEYKMSLTAVAALVHDVIITLGIYSLIGAEVTTSTIAALLTILGYSLYDTIVVFGRIKENTKDLNKMTFSDMANLSINEVFGRSINTTITSLIPVVTMLVFNVESLNGFALALTIGLGIGAYSSVAVAAPLYALWKEREPKYRALAKRYANNHGGAAVATAGAPVEALNNGGSQKKNNQKNGNKAKGTGGNKSKGTGGNKSKKKGKK